MKKYGLITNSGRGVGAPTPEGVKVNITEPRKIVRFVQRENQRQPGANILVKTPGDDVAEVVEDAGDEIAPWRENLLEPPLNIPPDAFERLCQRLLRESGGIIGGDLLVEKLMDLKLGVQTRMVEVVEVDTEWCQWIWLLGPRYIPAQCGLIS